MGISDGIRLYSALPRFEDARTWAEIDLGALRHNYKYLKALVTERAAAFSNCPQPICVVKADAYGHGACGCVPVFLEEGCRFFAVSSIEEGVEVRNICRNRGIKTNVLILGVTLPSLVRKLAEYDLITALPSPEYAERLSAAAVATGVRIRCHVKLDTGMNRLGFPAFGKDTDETATSIKNCTKKKGLKIEGIFTHFAEADDGDGEIPDGKTALQAERFSGVIKKLESEGVKIPFKHVCNSAAALRFPQLAYDGVRLGIALYGTAPSEEFSLPELRPVMSFKTKISHIHKLRVGEAVSYGGKFTADSERTLGTLPVGYADGFLRSYGGAGVLVRSENGSFNAPIVGRICMDQCMIDLTDSLDTLPRVGDEVTLFGDSPERLAALSERANTIPYEILCAVSARVIRIYKEDGYVL